MEVHLLGPFEVHDRDGHAVRVPAGRERALLALLAIERGAVVPTDRIVDVLWGASPPGTAAKAVQGYVSHLRRLLGEDALVTRAPGYALRQDAVAVDADRFAREAAEGRRALGEGAAEEARERLESALALWRGPALADFRYDDFARDEAARLEEARLAAAEDRMDALLALGRHAEAAGELGALVAANPYRERLRGQWMRALYLGGRQSEALAAHREGRRLLADELGIEPGPELQRLERMILTQDPALGAPAAPAPPASPPPAPARGSPRLTVAIVAAAVVAAAGIALALARGGGDGEAARSSVTPPAVIAIDPATERIVASVAAGSKPVSLAAGDGALWVGDARDATVTRIDPRTRRVVKTIGIGAPAIDLAAAPGGVWVATGGLGQVVRIDPSLDAVTRRIDLSQPGNPVVPQVSAVAAERGRVWAGAFDGVVRLDASSGRVTARVDLGSAAAQQIAAGGEALWATTLRRRAKRVDAGSAQVTGDFYAGAFIFPVALDDSSAWLGGDDGALWRIDAVTGAATLSTRAGDGSVTAIAIGEGAVWVAEQGGVWASTTGHDALMRVDPETGEVRATVPLAGLPQDVALAGGLVWVALQQRTER